jgi:pullulanase/glycogen debranching enzyme
MAVGEFSLGVEAVRFLANPPELASAAGVNDGGARPRIYELYLRQFSNLNPTRKPNGTLAENGVGKFRDLSDTALRALRELGITHLWLLGVVRQATATGTRR